MNIHLKNTIKVASVYAGTVIGAGFASGQEIMQFFIIYGYKGIYGIIFAALLFAVMGAIILNKVYCYGITGYDEYIIPLIGIRLGRSVELLICLFMVSSFCVMVAGSGAIFQEELKMGREFGLMMMAGLCLIVFLNDIKGVIMVNSILAPIMLVGMLLIGGYTLIFGHDAAGAFAYTARKISYHWLTSSFVYVSYNTLTLVIIMSALLPLLTKRVVAVMGGIAGGISLGSVAIILWMVMYIFYADIQVYEIPFLQIVIKQGQILEYMYVFILYGAMFTTAVASGYGFLNRVHRWVKLDKTLCAVIFCILAIPLANLGFARLVKILYPMFGYLGMSMMFVILLDGLKETCKGKKKKMQ